MVGNSPKFSPPIFINARVFNRLSTGSPNFSSPKTLEPLIRQKFPPPKFSHVWYSPYIICCVCYKIGVCPYRLFYRIILLLLLSVYGVSNLYQNGAPEQACLQYIHYTIILLISCWHVSTGVCMCV